MRVSWISLAGAAAASLAIPSTAIAATNFGVAPISNISTSCAGQNAEVEQAVDTKVHYVYEAWMGCSGIAFARSVDGGLTFGHPISVPGSVGSSTNSWDPALAVSPDGTVYAAFMIARSAQWYPVVAASFDRGATFSQVSALVPRTRRIGAIANSSPSVQTAPCT